LYFSIYINAVKILIPIAVYLFQIVHPQFCHAVDSNPMSHPVTVAQDVDNVAILDSAYLTLITGGKQYFAGFSIAPDGLNTPVIVEIDVEGGGQRYWEFEEKISDLFLFNSHISVVLDSGATVSLIGGAWQRDQLVVAEHSKIIYSAGQNNLIACSPSSFFKEGARESGCQSYNPNWKISFPWREIEPKYCGKYIQAVTWTVPKQRLFIDSFTGKVAHQEKYLDGTLCK
jgi:hypothetical protein